MIGLLRRLIVGSITFILIVFVLFVGFGTLAVLNLPRVVLPFRAFKVLLSHVSNFIGDIIILLQSNYVCNASKFFENI